MVSCQHWNKICCRVETGEYVCMAGWFFYSQAVPKGKCTALGQIG